MMDYDDTTASGQTAEPEQSASGGRPSATRSAQLWDLEFRLTVANNAFQRWIVRCMAHAGCAGLSALDVMVLHAINRRAPSRSMGDIALLLNIDDTRTISYSIKKLMSQGLVESRKRGKEKIFSTTAAGGGLCDRYIAERERFLMELVELSQEDHDNVASLSRILLKLAGSYDHAARAVMT